MRSFLKLFIFAGLVSALMTGCYPNEDLSYSDLDVAGTHYDASFTFETDMVCVLIADVKWAVAPDDEDAVRDNEIPNGQYIIDEVARNLEEFTKFDVYSVEDSAELRAKILDGSIPKPDLFVTISALEREFTYYYPYYGYWYGGYYGWYWKSGSLKSSENTNYYPYYPYYPNYGGTTVTYTAGTIFMDMIDASKLPNDVENAPMPVVWNGVVNGIESGSTSDHKSRITIAINQCFNQSPYLR